MTLFVGECRRCGAQHMSFVVYGISTMEAAHEFPVPPHYRRFRRTLELACRCHECNCTSVFILRAEAGNPHELPKDSFATNESPMAFGYREVGGFPARQPNATPAYTPEPAANFYKQATTALSNGLYDAAGAMFRKSLESVTRSAALVNAIPEAERPAFEKMWLKARIKKLKEVHAIPPALGDLVDVIKDEGDGAVHEDVVYDKDSAEALQRFTETFLEQTFTIPAQIAKVRSKKKG